MERNEETHDLQKVKQRERTQRESDNKNTH